MLVKLILNRFTSFSETMLDFGSSLNVLVGENGFGKTHVLKAAYTVCAVSNEAGKKDNGLTKSYLQTRIADKLVSVSNQMLWDVWHSVNRGESVVTLKSSFRKVLMTLHLVLHQIPSRR